MEEEDIYSTIPTGSDFEARQRILNLLVTTKKELTAKQIAREVGLPTNGSCREVRKEITHLLEINCEPIIATTKGFKYTKDSDELRQYAKQLQNRVQGMNRRIKSILEIAGDYVGLDNA